MAQGTRTINPQVKSNNDIGRRMICNFKTFIGRLFVLKPMAELQVKIETENELRRSLGWAQLLGLGVGFTIGIGIFVLSGQAAAKYAGPAVIISFIIAGIVAGLSAMSYSEMASMMPISGSGYTYAYAAMGQYFAWIVGWNMTIEYLIGGAAVAVGWSGYVVHLFETVSKLNATKWIVNAPIIWIEATESFNITKDIVNLPAIAIIAALTVLLIIDIDKSANVNFIVVAFKILIMLLFVFASCGYVNRSNYTPFFPPNQGSFQKYGLTGMLHGTTVVFFAYIGFDVVTTAAQEAKNPQRSLPIGIIGTFLISVPLYVAVCTVMVGVVPYTVLNTPSPVSEAIKGTPHGIWLLIIIDLGAIASLTSVILVSLIAQSRIFYSIAHDGLLPSVFTKVHPRSRTPWFSTIIIGVICAAFAGILPLNILGELSSISTLSTYCCVHICVIIMRFTHKNVPRGFRVPLGPCIIPVVGVLFCLLFMGTSSKETWIRFAVWVAIGQIVYFSYGFWHSKQRPSRHPNLTGSLSTPAENLSMNCTTNTPSFEMAVFSVDQQSQNSYSTHM